jgi:hypothetical protein
MSAVTLLPQHTQHCGSSHVENIPVTGLLPKHTVNTSVRVVVKNLVITWCECTKSSVVKYI